MAEAPLSPHELRGHKKLPSCDAHHLSLRAYGTAIININTGGNYTIEEVKKMVGKLKVNELLMSFYCDYGGYGFSWDSLTRWLHSLFLSSFLQQCYTSV